MSIAVPSHQRCSSATARQVQAVGGRALVSLGLRAPEPPVSRPSSVRIQARNNVKDLMSDHLYTTLPTEAVVGPWAPVVGELGRKAQDVRRPPRRSNTRPGQVPPSYRRSSTSSPEVTRRRPHEDEPGHHHHRHFGLGGSAIGFGSGAGPPTSLRAGSRTGPRFAAPVHSSGSSEALPDSKGRRRLAPGPGAGDDRWAVPWPWQDSRRDHSQEHSSSLFAPSTAAPVSTRTFGRRFGERDVSDTGGFGVGGHLHHEHISSASTSASTSASGSGFGQRFGRGSSTPPLLSSGAAPPGMRTLGPPPSNGRTALLSSVASEPNAKYRPYMEDAAVVVDPYQVNGEGEEVRWGYYAVYDGHGGRQAVDYCEARLHGVILEELRNARPWNGTPATDEAIAEALTRSFKRMDDQLRLIGAWRCGCTATVVLVRRTPTALRLHVANVGDSRCIVVDGCRGECRISCDHRPTDLSEIRRIESEGGFVSRSRVGGQLGVSRALGDHALKGSGVSWRPHVLARDATRDAALVIASDGLWDFMSDCDASQVVLRSMSEKAPEQAAQSLVDEAERRGSTDNITCLVTYLDAAAAFTPLDRCH